jgi:predicted dithiol-disulfide oxidoreductase (DUF899 family)
MVATSWAWKPSTSRSTSTALLGRGLPGVPLWADGFDRVIVHLGRRDVTMICASRAPLERLEAFKRRMGWNFRWVSSLRNEFNYDYGASFPEQRRAAGAKHTWLRRREKYEAA